MRTIGIMAHVNQGVTEVNVQLSTFQGTTSTHTKVLERWQVQGTLLTHMTDFCLPEAFFFAFPPVSLLAHRCRVGQLSQFAAANAVQGQLRRLLCQGFHAEVFSLAEAYASASFTNRTTAAQATNGTEQK